MYVCMYIFMYYVVRCLMYGDLMTSLSQTDIVSYVCHS